MAFILSYATSVLYKACFPEAVNLMRHCLIYNFFYSSILGVENQFNMNLHNDWEQLLLCCLANNWADTVGLTQGKKFSS